ncbi:MAG: permease-like cell division protein FtsX [Xanthomonadales bacterium]|nr:permease-like cell division protein FtsX [Xanthomonadales bacterium]
MSGLSLKRRARSWARRQLYSLFSSIGTLLGHKLASLMTVLVLGIAMALPLGLYVGVENLRAIDLNETDWASVTVFLAPGTDAENARAFSSAVEARGGASVMLISPDEGMKEFTASSGFSQAAQLFEDNPLPWVAVLSPRQGEAPAVEAWVNDWQAWLALREDVDLVQIDHKWVQRLAGFLALGEAAIAVLTVLFSLAVIVVVANTIRLDVASRAEEIEVMSMVGANSSFIRQPFLYSGFWYGLLGALLALLLLYAGLAYLHGPLERLLDAYGNQFRMHTLGPGRSAMVLLLGGLLGLAGAWVSVQRHLRLLAHGRGIHS